MQDLHALELVLDIALILFIITWRHGNGVQAVSTQLNNQLDSQQPRTADKSATTGASRSDRNPDKRQQEPACEQDRKESQPTENAETVLSTSGTGTNKRPRRKTSGSTEQPSTQGTLQESRDLLPLFQVRNGSSFNSVETAKPSERQENTARSKRASKKQAETVITIAVKVGDKVKRDDCEHEGELKEIKGKLGKVYWKAEQRHTWIGLKRLIKL